MINVSFDTVNVLSTVTERKRGGCAHWKNKQEEVHEKNQSSHLSIF